MALYRAHLALASTSYLWRSGVEEVAETPMTGEQTEMETRVELYDAQLARLQQQVAAQDDEKAALEFLLHQQHPDGSPGQVGSAQALLYGKGNMRT